MFKIENRIPQKTLILTVSGLVSESEARELIEAFKTKISTINPTEYKLVINAREQKASTKEVIPLQREAIRLYMDTPFKVRKSVVIGSKLTMKQIKAIGKHELLEKFEFVDTLEEALRD